MRKYEPLKLIAVTEFEGGHEPIEYYSRGHQNRAEFNWALERDYGIKVQPVEIKYTWWRFIPVPDHKGYYAIAKAHSRGAFPVTSWEATR